MLAMIAIGGGSCAGKSTLAHGIASAVGPRCTVLPLDAYFRDMAALTQEQLDVVSWDEPDVIDTDLLSEHLSLLRASQPVKRPVWDFPTHRRIGTVDVAPTSFLVVEGHLSLALRPVRDLCDHLIYLGCDDDVRLRRRMDRDVEQRGRTTASVTRQWSESVLPMHRVHIETSSQYATIHLDGRTTPAELVQQALRGMGISPTASLQQLRDKRTEPDT